MFLKKASIYTLAKMDFFVGIFAALFILLSLNGCSATLYSRGPITTNSAKESHGFRYYLTKDLVEVSVTRTIRVQKYVENDLSKIGRKISRTISDPVITPYNIKDTSAFYTLDLRLNWMNDNSLTIDATDTGVLKSVNGKSQGKAGEVIKNTLNIAGAILPFVAALGANENELENIAEKIELVSRRDRQSILGELALLSNEENFLLKKSTNARKVWLTILERNEKIVEAKNKKLEIEESIYKSDNTDNIIKKQEMVKFITESINRMSSERNAIRVAFNSMLTNFKQKEGIGSQSTSHDYKEMFELSEIPPIGKIEAGLTSIEVLSKFNKTEKKKFSKAINYFQRSGLILTTQVPSNTVTYSEFSDTEKKKFSKAINYFQRSGRILTIQVPSNIVTYSDIEAEIKREHGNDAVIFYRQKSPVTINVFSIKSMFDTETGDPNDKTKLIYTKSHNLIHEGSPVLYVKYDESSFAQHDMTLSFSQENNGVLTKIERKMTSPAEGATKALSEGLVSASNTLGTVSKNIATYQENERKIRKHGMQVKIDELAQKKQLLDAKIALDQTSVSQEDLIEKKRLDNELATLQSQLALDSASSTYQFNLEQSKMAAELTLLNKQLKLAKAKGIYDASLEIQLLTIQNSLNQLTQTQMQFEQTSGIKNQIEALTQELALIKLQQQIKELKREINEEGK